MAGRGVQPPETDGWAGLSFGLRTLLDEYRPIRAPSAARYDCRHETAGHLLSGRAFHVGEATCLAFSMAAYFTWNRPLLEGTGIKPDIEVALGCDRLRAGLDNQLQTAIDGR
jgi:hypothetical protein